MAEHTADLSGEQVSELSDEEINLRKKWLDFGPADEAAAEQASSLLDSCLDEMIEEIYARFLSLEETAAFFPDKEVINRASAKQKEYLRRLTKGNYDRTYVHDRLQVGSTHNQINLSPKWYLGAYNHILEWLMKLILDHCQQDTNKFKQLFSAMRKLIFFDIGLAMESYMSAQEASIRAHLDSLAHLETARRATKSLLEGAPLGIVELNTEFRLLECNEAFLTILGVAARRDLAGKELFEIVSDLPRGPFERAVSSGQSFHANAAPLNFAHRSSENATYWDWAAWPMRNATGETIGVVATFSGATERVLLQQQREDFVATLTHDLKTPILAANRAVKLLIEGDFGPVSESQSRILETIYESNETMYTLVQTLLDVYRYDSGAKKLKIGSHNLSSTIIKLVAELQPLATARSITLVTKLPKSPAIVRCDEEEIRRVVQNLIDNSLKHTPASGQITVNLEQSAGKTTVKVTDNGKGIREEDRPKLFQRFWQATSSGRYYASTGLGLYLCRQIVEFHAGQIWCESQVGHGSTFAFQISSPEL